METTSGQTLSRTANAYSSATFMFDFPSLIAQYRQPMPHDSEYTDGQRSVSGAEPADEDLDGRPQKRRRHVADERQRREIGLMRQSDDTNLPSFVGSSSGIHFVRSVYHALAKSRVQLPPQTPDQSVVPGEEDMLEGTVPYSSKNLWSPEEIEDNSNGIANFDFEDLQIWSESYFENWHTAYPFFHAPTILEYLEQRVRPATLSDLGIHGSPQSTILRSMISISLADRRQSGRSSEKPVPSCLVFKSFREAMESVQDMLFLPSSVEALQAVVSVQLFLVSMLRLNGASRLGGLIVRMTFQLGLHRCPARYAGFDNEQSGLRRRLFWSIYCIDRYLCQSLGLPLTIRDDDVDVCHLDEEQHVLDKHHRTAMDVRLKSLNFLARHASIKGQIMELRNKSIHQRTADRDLATLIGAKIEKFANDIQYEIDAAEHDEALRLHMLHKTFLLISQYELVISLHRPLLALEKHTSEYMAAIQTCIRASRAIITILSQHLHSRTAQECFYSAPLLFPPFTWCVWQSSFIILHAALEGEVPKPTARRLADDSVKILKHLALRGSVWPNVCAVAINDLFLRLLLDSNVTTPQASSAHTNNPEQGYSMHSQRNTGLGTFPEAVTDQQNNRSRLLGAENDFSTSTLNVTDQFSTTFDAQLPIPWLSDTDAAATSTSNIFEQFDIPFWMGDDQYTSLLNFDI